MLGKRLVQRHVAAKFGRFEPKAVRHAPLLGEHNARSAARDRLLGRGDRAALKEEAVIGDTPNLPVPPQFISMALKLPYDRYLEAGILQVVEAGLPRAARDRRERWRRVARSTSGRSRSKARTSVSNRCPTHHLDALIDAGQPEEIWQWLPRRLQTRADFEGWLAHSLAMQERGDQLVFVTVSRETGAAVGSTSFLAISPPNRRLEIGGTWLTPAAQRTPVNTECKYLLLRHCFETLGCLRVELKDGRPQHELAARDRADRRAARGRVPEAPTRAARLPARFGVLQRDRRRVARRKGEPGAHARALTARSLACATRGATLAACPTPSPCASRRPRRTSVPGLIASAWRWRSRRT